MKFIAHASTGKPAGGFVASGASENCWPHDEVSMELPAEAS